MWMKHTRRVPFPEFIKRVFNSRDKHWTPLNEACQYCLIQYDFIGRIEKFDEDIRYVAERNNFTHILNREKTYHLNDAKALNKVKETHTMDTQEKTTYYLSQLSKDLLSHLKQYYRIDFEMFGYDPNQYL